jgi:hypothetical protein
MSTEKHNTSHEGRHSPKHTDVAFEASDVKTQSILRYFGYLALAVVATYIVCLFVYRFTTKLAVGSETPPLPVRQEVGPILPPEPRLQGVPGHENDPQLDLRNKMAADEKENEKLEWVDRQAGIARIPVKDAMKIIAAKGLPAAPAAAGENKK